MTKMSYFCIHFLIIFLKNIIFGKKNSNQEEFCGCYTTQVDQPTKVVAQHLASTPLDNTLAGWKIYKIHHLIWLINLFINLRSFRLRIGSDP